MGAQGWWQVLRPLPAPQPSSCFRSGRPRPRPPAGLVPSHASRGRMLTVSPRWPQSHEGSSGYRNRRGQFLPESAGLSFAPSLALVFVPVRVQAWGLLTPSVLSDRRQDDRLRFPGAVHAASPGSLLHRSFWKHEQLDSFGATTWERPEPWAAHPAGRPQGPGGSKEPGVCPFGAGRG